MTFPEDVQTARSELRAKDEILDILNDVLKVVQSEDLKCNELRQSRIKKMVLNLHAAWIGFFLGCLAGATPGLFFYRDDWLGGYSSWPRRMIRLAHISFFGIGFLNISFGLTAKTLGLETGLQPASGMLIVGAVTMPIVCYLSAWKPIWRHAFFVPALSVILGVGLFLWRITV